jgi:hypothetical protein
MVPKGRSETTMADPRTLYDEDFVAWTEEQAEGLRAAARAGSNLQLDWENLAEEIESLGRSDRRELHSQIYRIIRHLAKLQFSPASDPRRGWRETIGDGRKEVELVLADSPSLKQELGQIAADETASAIRRAISDLGEFGEVDRATERALRRARYTVDQIVGDWLPADPPRRDDAGR